MSEALGLYVHVPFCEAKCTYCHFAIDPRRPGEDRQERYLRALLAEVEAAPLGRVADTLYLGGGTPTLLALDRLERLFAALRRRFAGLRRCQGVPLGDFRERYGLDPLVAYADPLRDAFAAGLLEVADDRLRLTPRGMLLSNEVFRAFV